MFTPELLEMAAEAAKIRELVAEEREERTSFLQGPKRAPFTQEFPRFGQGRECHRGRSEPSKAAKKMDEGKARKRVCRTKLPSMLAKLLHLLVGGVSCITH